MERATRTDLVTGAVLLTLLALTVLFNRLPLGPLSLVVAMFIAATKATLVAVVFMHLRTSSPVMRLFSVAGLLWLTILIGLTLSDYLTREPPPVPPAVARAAEVRGPVR